MGETSGLSILTRQPNGIFDARAALIVSAGNLGGARLAAIRDFLWALSVFTVVAALFFASLAALQHFPGRMGFADEAQSLMAALQDYRSEFGAYPVLTVVDSPATELKKMLANAGRPPRESSQQDAAARYVSNDGKSYGLLFHLGPPYNNQPARSCLIEVNASNTGWWAQPPKCPL